MSTANEIAREAIDRWSVSEFGRDCLDEWGIDVRRWSECQVAYATVELIRRIMEDVVGYGSPWTEHVTPHTYRSRRREVFFDAANLNRKEVTS